MSLELRRNVWVEIKNEGFFNTSNIQIGEEGMWLMKETKQDGLRGRRKKSVSLNQEDREFPEESRHRHKFLYSSEIR